MRGKSLTFGDETDVPDGTGREVMAPRPRTWLRTADDPRSDRGAPDRKRLTTLQGLAALSLDALSSVAYGPEAIVLVLVGAGAGALRLTLPVTFAITVLLAVLVISYGQVIAVHPDGGGAYAVARSNLGPTVSLLAAASLVVDYVLTVAVSLAAGAAALIATFPQLAGHRLSLALGGLFLLTAVNLRGAAASARVLITPTLVFVAGLGAAIVAGLLRSTPAALIGAPPALPTGGMVSLLVLLRAFAAGSSALTGVEAIANAVPLFRAPAVRRAQRTELLLGLLLGLLLIGIAVLIVRFHITPRRNVTVLAQVTAAGVGTGPAFDLIGTVTTGVLLLAANTSYGGLPVLLSLLARDNRMPHLFALRAEGQVYRYGVVALTIMAGLLLLATDGDTHRLIPLFAIGVFLGFTISQTGLVRHWARTRTPGWLLRASLNGFGAVLTGTATGVFLATKFTAGAWVVAVAIPLLMLTFDRVHRYYRRMAEMLGLGRTPPPPAALPNLIIVPVGGISRVTAHALGTALSMDGDVVAISVQFEQEAADALRRAWDAWDPGVPLRILHSPHYHLVQPVVDFVRATLTDHGRHVTVLLVEIEPRRRRHEILHNHRAVLLAAVLRQRTGAIVATVPFRLPD
jgi:amino acid transporter